MLELKELRKENIQLVEEKDNLKNILQSMPGYIYWKNTRSEYMGCNNNLALVSNLNQPDDIIGKTDFDFKWGKKYAQQYIEDDKKVMEKKELLTIEHKMPHKRQDGQYYIVRTEKSPLYKNGEVVGIIGVAVDITKEKNLEEKISVTENIARDNTILANVTLNNSVVEAILAVAHEINQPLSAVSNYAAGCYHYLKKQYGENLPPHIEQGLKECMLQAKRAGDIVHGLKDFLGNNDGKREHYDINLIIENLLTLLNNALGLEKIEIILNLEHQLPKIKCNLLQIELVLTNLIKNSCEAMNESSKKTLTISTKNTHNGDIRIGIKDTGSGIKAEILSNLFAPFMTTKPTGLGLGLSLAYNIVQRHEGKIYADTQSKSGSIFYVELATK